MTVKKIIIALAMGALIVACKSNQALWPSE
jgi:hypothetical protein